MVILEKEANETSPVTVPELPEFPGYSARMEN